MSFRVTVTFQAQVLSLLVNDMEILDKYRACFTPDFFEFPPYKNMSRMVLEYYDEYSGIASKDSLSTMVENFLAEDPTHQAYQQTYFDTITKIYSPLTASDYAFIKKNLESAIRQRMMQQAIVRSAVLVEDGSYEQITANIEKASSFGFLSDDNTLHWNDMTHFVYSTEPEEIPIPTGFSRIDDDLHGGIRPGEMGFIVAPSGRGKSHWLHNLAKGALAVGKKVHYYTLELTQKQVVRRLDANIGDTTYWDLRNPDLEKIAYQRVTDFIEEHPGADFTVTFFPAKSVTVKDISNHIKRMRTEREPADLILIDYGDIIRPSHAYNNSYDEQGSIYQDLVGLAQTWKVGLWTAAQSNRAGFNAREVAMEMLSDSIKKAFVADYVFLFGQTKEERAAKLFRLHGAKVRSHESSGEYKFRCDLSKSKMWEISDREFITLCPNNEEVAGDNNYHGAVKIRTEPPAMRTVPTNQWKKEEGIRTQRLGSGFKI